MSYDSVIEQIQRLGQDEPGPNKTRPDEKSIEKALLVLEGLHTAIIARHEEWSDPKVELADNQVFGDTIARNSSIICLWSDNNDRLQLAFPCPITPAAEAIVMVTLDLVTGDESSEARMFTELFINYAEVWQAWQDRTHLPESYGLPKT